MIYLNFKTRKFDTLNPGDLLHLRVSSVEETARGRWKVTVDDVTPLPGVEPLGYACGSCGVIDPAQKDGSLPAGWVVKEFQKGTKYFCQDCEDEPICRVCGCTHSDACWDIKEGVTCHWVELDLCSACVEP